MPRQDSHKVVKLRLTSQAAKKRVNALAKKTDNLIWTIHVQEQMEKRGIQADDVLKILRQGDVEEEPEAAKKEGEWKVKIVEKLETGRVAGVVTVITKGSRLVLVTTEWEDHR
jgi:uncharacterized DUF497 family protein